MQTTIFPGGPPLGHEVRTAFVCSAADPGGTNLLDHMTHNSHRRQVAVCFDFFSSKISGQIEGVGNMEVLGTCGRVVIAGRILLPVFCCGVWGEGLTFQNRWNGV